MDELDCPWCGYQIVSRWDGYDESEIWEEGDHDIECPECGMHFTVVTEYVRRFDVDVWDALRRCEGGCGFYGIDRCTAGDLDPNLELPEGVPAWCPRLKGERR